MKCGKEVAQKPSPLQPSYDQKIKQLNKKVCREFIMINFKFCQILAMTATTTIYYLITT